MSTCQGQLSGVHEIAEGGMRLTAYFGPCMWRFWSVLKDRYIVDQQSRSMAIAHHMTGGDIDR
jgi:hypothetical protein